MCILSSHCNHVDALSRFDVNLTLTCEAEGFPSPAVHWEDSEGMPVSSSALLELAPVMFGDEGVYYCVAETTVTVGNDSITITALSMNATLTGKLYVSECSLYCRPSSGVAKKGMLIYIVTPTNIPVTTVPAYATA